MPLNLPAPQAAFINPTAPGVGKALPAPHVAPGAQHAPAVPVIFLQLPWKIIYCAALSAPRGSCSWMLISPPPCSSAFPVFFPLSLLLSPSPHNLLRCALSPCAVTLRAQPRRNSPFMSRQRFIPGVSGSGQVSAETFSVTSVGLQFITLERRAGTDPLGWRLLGDGRERQRRLPWLSP